MAVARRSAAKPKAAWWREYLPPWLQFAVVFGSLQGLYYLFGDEFGLARQPEEPLPGKTWRFFTG